MPRALLLYAFCSKQVLLQHFRAGMVTRASANRLALAADAPTLTDEPSKRYIVSAALCTPVLEQ